MAHDSRENAYFTVFENLGDAVLLLNREHHIIDLNQAARRLIRTTGVVCDIHASTMPQQVLPWLGGIAEQGCDEKPRCVQAGNSQRHFEVKCFTVAPSGPHRVEHIVTLRDITEQQVAERALSESEEHFRNLMELSPIPISMYDAAGWRTGANHAYRDLWQLSPGELENHPLNLRAQAELIGLGEQAEQLFRGETISAVEFHFDPARFGRPGRPRYVRCQGYSITDANGQVAGIVMIYEDRTEAREAEGALLQSRKMLKAVIDHIPLGVFWKGRDFRYLGCNTTFARDTGFRDPEEVVGQTDTDMPWREDADRISKDDFEVLHSGVPKLNCEERLVLAGGDAIWTRLSRIPLFDHEGESVAVLGCYENTTDQKRFIAELEAARLQAESASRAKSDFLSTVSHEMRTPLNAIVGMAEVLNDADLPHQLHEYTRVLQTASNSLLELINDLLDLSKIEAGHLQLESRPFSITDVVNEVSSVLEPRASAKGLKLLVETHGMDGLRVEGAPVRLGQVLTNLVANAIKFTPEGFVALEAWVEHVDDTSTRVGFRVSDSGIGIPETKHDSIFAPFGQVDSTNTRRYGGSGLGLAISRRLVEHMGGKISLLSAPDSGSIFSFELTLPLATPENESEERIESEPPTATGLRLPQAQVLLVEDSPLNQVVVKAFLRNSAVELTIASNGREAVSLVEEQRFDLILMDIQMPTMDGIEATRHIREIERRTSRARTPIVAMTAHAMAGQADHWLAAGCDDSLTKPIRRSDFLKRLRRHLKLSTTGTSGQYEALRSPSNSVQVRVDPALLPHVETAKSELSELSGRILSALDAGDLALAQSLAHRVKGDAGTYGFTAASQFGAQIERAASSGDRGQARMTTERLRHYFNHVTFALDSTSPGEL